MASQDVIVVGASAGGVEALVTLVRGLPVDLPASIFIVLHIGLTSSRLPEILTRAGRLPAVHPANGDAIRNGTIYVAPPDCHMLVEPGHVQLSHGPKENRTRPAINPLFRSAAYAFKSRVTGVILTGGLDDGTSGLAQIKRHGGVAIVQDPTTAFSSSMPQSAISHVDVDYVMPVSEIAPLLVSIVNGAHREEQIVMPDETSQKILTGLTCPECRGPLSEQRHGRIIEFTCRVGHVYSPLTLAQGHHETVERTLWAALVALEEAAEINDRIAPGSLEQKTKLRGQVKAVKGLLDDHLESESSA